MAAGVEILDLAVVGPLVGDVEGGRDGAAVRVFAPLLEQVGVEALVQVVDRVVERQEYDLRYLLRQVVTCCLMFGSVSGSFPDLREERVRTGGTGSR